MSGAGSRIATVATYAVIILEIAISVTNITCRPIMITSFPLGVVNLASALFVPSSSRWVHGSAAHEGVKPEWAVLP